MSAPTATQYELRPLPDGRNSKVRDRFWTRVDRTPGQGPKGECWEWMGCRVKGTNYGKVGAYVFTKRQSPIGAHVMAYFLTRGEWPQRGLEVCHSCDNTACVRPDHLWLGTHKQNMKDAQAKGRMPTAPPPAPKQLRIRFLTAQLVKIHEARRAAHLSIYEVGIIIDLNYTGYYKFEAGHRPSLTVEQFEKLKGALKLDGLKISDSQYYEHGHPGVKPGKKGSPAASAKKAGARLFRPHKAWLKLPPAYIGNYRADLIRGALLKSKMQMKEVSDAAGVHHYRLKDVLNGVSLKRDHVLAVINYVGLSESDIFNTREAQAA